MSNPSINEALLQASESVSPDFQSWPKIPRLSKEHMTITEKIDGTNAQILITAEGEFKTGSRNRWVTPEDDNFGFSKWAHENKEVLMELGPGRHFGEWWGLGIQRRYGMVGKRFSLFNVDRILSEPLAAFVSKVPLLYRGPFDTQAIEASRQILWEHGSLASPGFRNPEGFVVYLCQTKCRHKVIFDSSEQHKWETAKNAGVVSVSST